MEKKFTFFLIVIFSLSLFGFKGDDKQARKTNLKDRYAYININKVLMWVSNNGDGSHDPRTDGNGYYWPDQIKSAVFEDGLVWGAKIGDEIRFNGNTHRQGLQAGKIIDGFPDDPDLEKYRIYKIRRDWESFTPGLTRDALEKDYNEWPIEDGAPYIDVDNDGKPTPGIDKPQFIGDETLWFVSNDMDTNRTAFTYGSKPIGLEIQTTVYGYKAQNTLGDVVFKKYKVINKSKHNLKDMYFGYWSDPDMGDAGDDFNGCDTLLDLGYVYNAYNTDGTYGTPPPAVGYTLLQGPLIPGNADDSAKFLDEFRHGYKNMPMTAFVFYIGGSSTYRDPSQGIYSGSLEFYNYLQGNVWNGENFIDPITGDSVNYILAGDPVAGTGWYESTGSGGWPGGPPPGDRRFLLSAGPFNMAPGDTQEIVLAIHMALGSTNLNSVTEMKKQSNLLKDFYLSDIIVKPEAPVLYSVSEDRSAFLWWEKNSESYTFTDPFISDTIEYNLGAPIKIPVLDSTYDFEGYRIWQYKDTLGTDPILLATYDLENGISMIYEYPYEALRVNNQVSPFQPILVSPDSGLRSMISINRDGYTGERLYNGSEYYFAVTAYAYNKYSEPPVLESMPRIITVTPGTPAIDDKLFYNRGDRIKLAQTSGQGDGIVELLVVDPYKLTGHDYKVVINGELNQDILRDSTTSYNFINVTTGDTLIFEGKDFLTSEFGEYPDDYNEFKIPESDIYGKPVYDGFILLVHQQGIDSIEVIDYAPGGRMVGVKGVYEVAGPGGNLLERQRYVFQQLNSTGEWQTNVSMISFPTDPKQNLNYQGATSTAIGYKDYEIRFTGSSEYYTFFTEQLFSGRTKASGTVPFEIWDVGNNVEEPGRLYVNIQDINGDGVWSYDEAKDAWEPIYVNSTPDPYIEPIPEPPVHVLGSYRHFGRLVFEKELPENGSLVRLEAWQPLSKGDVFEGTAVAPQLNNSETAKQNIDKISVFPNPYYAASPGTNTSYVRFTNLPQRVIFRIYSLGGVFIKKIEKDDDGQYVDWDLLNKDGLTVGSGVYLIYAEFPGIGTKIMKLAVVN